MTVLRGRGCDVASAPLLVPVLVVAILAFAATSALAAAPTVSTEKAEAVGSSAATLGAEIAPNGLSTEYHVEYVSEAQLQAQGWVEATDVPTSDAELPASSEAVHVSESLSGLQPATAYVFRFVATNTLGARLGEEVAFTTTSSGGSTATLPDGRVAELVSNSGNVGEPLQPASHIGGQLEGINKSEHPFQAAEDGEAVTYVGEPAATGGTGEIGEALGNQWLASRTAEGWKTEDITAAPAPGAEFATGPERPIYQAFSDDLSSDIFIGPSRPLVPELPAECRGLYARSAGSGAYQALFTQTNSNAVENYPYCGKPLFAGASEDGADVIFQSEGALTPEAEVATEVPPGRAGHNELGAETGEPCMFGCNLYVSVAGHTRLVSVLEGKPITNATFGGYGGERHGSEAEFTNFSRAISTDGSRIFWTDTQPGEDFEHVYVLEDGTSTIPVSGAGSAEYWTATPNGRYAYYTEAGELWRFDTQTNTRERLTAEEALVQGVVGTNQTGEDGAYVYFVADGVLAGNENANHETVAEGQPNLYMLHGGVTTFVATLSPEDNQINAVGGGSQNSGDWMPNLGLRTAEVTPDGRNLVFESVRSLTGYDNVVNSVPTVDAFVYSADEGKLACASCNPTGVPPAVSELNGPDTRLPVSNGSDVYVRRWISEDGSRVFFDSEQPLVPGDLNAGVQNVYEWEREGYGSCAATTPSRLDRGCVSLLSAADSSVLSSLVDADADGNNVFVEHVGSLGLAHAPVGHNELYDLRVNGGFAKTSFACAGTGCQGVPPAPPLFATPASVTFAGTGNFATGQPGRVTSRSLTQAQKLAKALKACAVKPRRKRAACKRQALKRYGAKGNSKTKKSHGGRSK